MCYLTHLIRIFPVQIPETRWAAESNNFKWGLNKSVKTKPISALSMNKGFIVNKLTLKLVGRVGDSGKQDKWILIHWEGSSKCWPLRTLSFQVVSDFFFLLISIILALTTEAVPGLKRLLFSRRMKESRQIETTEDLF